MGEHAESFAGEVIDGGPEVSLRNWFERPYDDAIAAARTCYSPRVIDADEITDAPAQPHRAAHLRRRTPHRLPARDLRVRALGRLAPARLVLPARLPVLQHRAAEPALRAARRGARARAARARRRGARACTRPAIERAWRAYRELTRAARAGDASAILSELWRLKERQSRAFGKSVRARGREEGDRDRALRDPDRLPHGDGLHGLGPHAAPAAPHGRGLRRPAGGAPRGRPDGGRGASASTRPSSSEVGEPPLASEDVVEAQARAAAASATPRALEAFDKSLAGRTLAARRLGRARARGGRRRRAPRARPRRARRRRGARAGARPGAEPLPARDAERLLPRAADARARPRPLHVPQEALAHGRLAGPAPPHGAGLAAAAHAHRADRARRGRAGADRATTRPATRSSSRAVEAAWDARARLLALGVAPELALYVLPNALAVRFEESGIAAASAPQVDDAHLPERAARDLGGLDGGGRAGARRASRADAPRRAALRGAQRPGRAALHRGHALLRRPGLAELPRRRADGSDRGRHPCARRAALPGAAAAPAALALDADRPDRHLARARPLQGRRHAKNAEAKRWEDRVWVFEKTGDRLALDRLSDRRVRRRDRPLRAPSAATARAACSPTGRRTRRSRPSSPAGLDGQLARLEVRRRCAAATRRAGSRASTAAAAPVDRSSPTRRPGASRACPTSRVFTRRTRWAAAAREDVEGRTLYKTTTVEAGGNVLRGSFDRDGTRKGTFRLTRGGAVHCRLRGRRQVGTPAQQHQARRVHRRCVAPGLVDPLPGGRSEAAWRDGRAPRRARRRSASRCAPRRGGAAHAGADRGRSAQPLHAAHEPRGRARAPVRGREEALRRPAQADGAGRGARRRDGVRAANAQ